MTWGPWQCKLVASQWGPYSSALKSDSWGHVMYRGQEYGQFQGGLVGVGGPKEARGYGATSPPGGFSVALSSPNEACCPTAQQPGPASHLWSSCVPSA